MPQRTTRTSALILEIVARRRSILAAPPHGPVQGSPTRMAPGGGAQRGARRRDAGLEPPGRRPRRPGLPHRAVPARRPGDLERQLVRAATTRSPTASSSRRWRRCSGPQVVGSAGGRRLLLPLRPPRPRPLGGGGALGDALVRRRGRDAARRRPADLRARGRLRPRRAALPAGGPLDARRSLAAAACALASPVAAAFLGGRRPRRRAGAGPPGSTGSRSGSPAWRSS